MKYDPKAEGLACGKQFQTAEKTKLEALKVAAKHLTSETLDAFLEGFAMAWDNKDVAKARKSDAKAILTALIAGKQLPESGTFNEIVGAARKANGAQPRTGSGNSDKIQTRTIETVCEKIGTADQSQQMQVLAATAQAMLSVADREIAAFRAASDILGAVINAESSDAAFKKAAEKAQSILDTMIERAAKAAAKAAETTEKAKGNAPKSEPEEQQPAKAAQPEAA